MSPFSPGERVRVREKHPAYMHRSFEMPQ